MSEPECAREGLVRAGPAWFSELVTLVVLVGNALRRPCVQAWTERVTGGALVALGLRPA